MYAERGWEKLLLRLAVVFIKKLKGPKQSGSRYLSVMNLAFAEF
jgi:hypothetical protein